MRLLHRHLVAEGDVVNVAVTDRDDGDLAVGSPDVERRRRHLVDRPWRWLQQVHGADVIDGDDPGVRPGVEGDAVVSSGSDVALAVQAADCVPLAIIADDGPFAVVHAGWRGLTAGVIGATADELRARSSAPLRAVVGPFIRAECYEFGDELMVLVDRFGAGVAAKTSDGRPALDLEATVRAALADANVELVGLDERCTCADELFSHRLRADRARHALIAWRER